MDSIFGKTSSKKGGSDAKKRKGGDKQQDKFKKLKHLHPPGMLERMERKKQREQKESKKHKAGQSKKGSNKPLQEVVIPGVNDGQEKPLTKAQIKRQRQKAKKQSAAASDNNSSSSSDSYGSGAAPMFAADDSDDDSGEAVTSAAPSSAPSAGSKAKKGKAKGAKQSDKEGLAAASSAAFVPIKPGDNEYLALYEGYSSKWPSSMSRLFDPSLTDKQRKDLMSFLDFDFDVAEKYADAIPDERALRAIHHFGPVLQPGAKNGYWGYLLRKAGVDYIGCEEKGMKADQEWCDIKTGGADIVSKQGGKRSLLISYIDDPDDEESRSLTYLSAYKGDTVIHVGEIFGTALGEDPWGKSTNASFQQVLAASFHKVLQLPLPSWPGTSDTLTVWKRSKISEDEEVGVRYVPASQRIDLNMACDSIKHLLQ